MKVKESTITELEGLVESLKLSLESAQTEAEAKASQAPEFESSKLSLETMLQETKDALAKLEAEYEELKSNLGVSKEEVSIHLCSSSLILTPLQFEAAKAASSSSDELTATLNEQIQKLESEILTANENLEAAKASHDLATSEAASAAAIDKEALTKAHADLEALTKDAEQLKQTHASASLEAQTKVTALEAKLKETEELTSQLAALRAEKEDTATKISEFEVEILELKETQETLEDERLRLTNVIKALEGDLAQARGDLDKAAENLSAAEERHTAAIDELQKKHSDELTVATEKQSEVANSLQAVQNELQVAHSDLEKARTAAGEAEEASKVKLSEVEQAYMAAQNELSERVVTITTELEVNIFSWRGQVLTVCL